MSAYPPGSASTDPAMTLEAGQTAKILRPTARFMLSHPAHFIALGFGSGLSPVVPAPWARCTAGCPSS